MQHPWRVHAAALQRLWGQPVGLTQAVGQAGRHLAVQTLSQLHGRPPAPGTARGQRKVPIRKCQQQTTQHGAATTLPTVHTNGKRAHKFWRGARQQLLLKQGDLDNPTVWRVPFADPLRLVHAS